MYLIQNNIVTLVQDRKKKQCRDVLYRKQNLIDHKEVSTWFWSKILNFFILSSNSKQEEKILVIFQKATFQRPQKSHFQKVQNWHSFKGVSPWFWSKIPNFLIFSFFFKIGREKSFYNVLDKKQPFINHENISFQKV